MQVDIQKPFDSVMNIFKNNTSLSVHLLYSQTSISGPLLSGHPLLNGHLSNSQKAVPLFTVNLTSVKRAVFD